MLWEMVENFWGKIMVAVESFPLDESILISRNWGREGWRERKKNFDRSPPFPFRDNILGAVLMQVKALIIKGSF